MKSKGYNLTRDFDLICAQPSWTAEPHNEEKFSLPVSRIGLSDVKPAFPNSAFCLDGNNVLISVQIGKRKCIYIPEHIKQGWYIAEANNRRALWPDSWNSEVVNARLAAIRIFLSVGMNNGAADAARNAGLNEIAVAIEKGEFDSPLLKDIMAFNLVEKW